MIRKTFTLDETTARQLEKAAKSRQVAESVVVREALRLLLLEGPKANRSNVVATTIARNPFRQE